MRTAGCLTLFLSLVCCHGSGGDAADMKTDMGVKMAKDMTPDLSCPGDLSGSPLQICGFPDAGFYPPWCMCIGDP